MTAQPSIRAPLVRASHGRIAIDDLSINFGSHQAVSNFTLHVEPGEFVCLLGPSGCGKSTVLNGIAGFVAPTTGSILVDDERVTKPGPERGMVFQQHSLLPWKTVLENVALGPRMRGLGKADARLAAREYLDQVGLGAWADHYPAALSGGMAQRVGIARALVNHPKILLMDEPFGALDAQTRSIMQENLLKLWGLTGNTVLFVTHDIDEALFLADRVIVISAAPGTVLLDLKNDLPRPRPQDVFAHPSFADYKRECLRLIRQESGKAFDFANGTGI